VAAVLKQPEGRCHECAGVTRDALSLREPIKPQSVTLVGNPPDGD
jgi:hypothetical protein